MQSLRYDPAQGKPFWEALAQIPAYPHGETIPLRTILIESGALFRLPEVLRAHEAGPEKPLLVVMDPAFMRRGEEPLKPLVMRVLQEAGWQPEKMILEPDASGQVHTDMPHIQAVKARLGAGGAALAVGSGVVTDVTKHACYLIEKETGVHIPFVIFQTANSVNAFTSNMAPIFYNGVKRTLDSRFAEALVCDLETLRDAPWEMTAAGVGDLLAAFVALPDWYLANRLGMDPTYTGLFQAMLGPFDQILLEQAGEIRARTLEGMSVLARLITLGGLGASLSRCTTPGSGYEHVISHVLDLQNERSGRPLAQHGSQASLAAVLSAETYRIFLAEFDPQQVDLKRCYPTREEMKDRIERSFASLDPSGKVGQECWNDYRIKLEAWHANRESLAAFLCDWPEIRREAIALTATPERLLEILSTAGAPVRFGELTPPADEAMVKFAYLHAPLIRRRLTIADLLIFFGWDREKLWQRVWQRVQSITP